MLRSGLFLSVSGPAALLTLLIQPTIQKAADQWTPSATISAPGSVSAVSASGVQAMAPITSPTRMAAIPSTGPRAAPTLPLASRTASDKDPIKVRRPIQEGCERAISSLAGPEARRMVAGRCMT
ncbi:hypothetical protein G3T14_05190 [Methylobacterium sp. BTF04]|uniref:hypothetical protein n=1 Tax=Methylobacterium sp. BTF04 TaxID=2708300 RepID=UPI0013D4DE7D|nr:hypothetical protein [Methylobacterium sp. BTF04]NEU11521.1 hypothetical protein [Methylobacterium sp. BTF04]